MTCRDQSFFLNDHEVVSNLQMFLVDLGLTGTKLGCGEGGCGACTVMVSSYDRKSKTSVCVSVPPICWLCLVYICAFLLILSLFIRKLLLQALCCQRLPSTSLLCRRDACNIH